MIIALLLLVLFLFALVYYILMHLPQIVMSIIILYIVYSVIEKLK